MRILFIDVGTNLKTVRDLASRARGGMVTSLFRVSDYLSRMGHHVFVSSDIESPGQTKFGTNWIHEPYGKFDVLISNRGTGEGYPEVDAKARILWTHDLPHSGFIPEPRYIKAYDCTVFMSRYAEGIWRAYYRTIGKSALIPNGVDKQVFYPREKDLGYLIYPCAPNRGLEKLPLIADSINESADRDVYCKAFSNLAVMHPGEGQDDFDYKSIHESTVELHDPLPQHKFAAELGRAGLAIIPSSYPEICSNNVLQALASGTPVITTGGLGATPEWVKHRKNGMLTKYTANDYMIYPLEIVRNAVEVLNDERLHKKLIRGALKTKVLTWSEVGRKWLTLLSRFS